MRSSGHGVSHLGLVREWSRRVWPGLPVEPVGSRGGSVEVVGRGKGVVGVCRGGMLGRKVVHHPPRMMGGRRGHSVGRWVAISGIRLGVPPRVVGEPGVGGVAGRLSELLGGLLRVGDQMMRERKRVGGAASLPLVALLLLACWLPGQWPSRSGASPAAPPRSRVCPPRMAAPDPLQYGRFTVSDGAVCEGSFTTRAAPVIT